MGNEFRGDDRLHELRGRAANSALRRAIADIRSGSGRRLAAEVPGEVGPGIAPELRSPALERGIRLDERGGSIGIGLAIVQDVLDAYGWTLDLVASELGGLEASFHEKSNRPVEARSLANSGRIL